MPNVGGAVNGLNKIFASCRAGLEGIAVKYTN